MNTDATTTTGEGNAPRETAANQQFLFIQHREVSEQEFDDACEAAHNLVKLGRLRAYLLPVLAQQAKNIASAAASSISDFEAFKRSKEMLNRIESEEAQETGMIQEED